MSTSVVQVAGNPSNLWEKLGEGFGKDFVGISQPRPENDQQTTNGDLTRGEKVAGRKPSLFVGSRIYATRCDKVVGMRLKPRGKIHWKVQKGLLTKTPSK